MRRLIGFVLALAMTCSLAWAAPEYEDTTPPVWQEMGFATQEELLEQLDMTQEQYYEILVAPNLEYQREVAQYLADHPDEVAAFDAEAWFAQSIFADWYESSEEYRMDYDLTQEEFRTEMLERWAGEMHYFQQHQQEIDEYAAQYPEQYAAFDPVKYFEQSYYYSDTYGTPEEYMQEKSLTEEQFRLEMAYGWMTNLEWQKERQRELEEFIRENPEEYAAFDPVKYFEQSYYYSDTYGTPEEYMQEKSLTEEQFRLEMAYGWMTNLEWQKERQRELEEFIRENPEEYAAFDPVQQFEQSYNSYYYDSPEEYMQEEGLTQEQFRLEMAYMWMNDLEQRQRQQREQEEFIRENSEEYAAFDPMQYFQQSYYSYLYDSAEQCMQAEGLTEEQFREEMTREWMTELERQKERQREVEEYIHNNPEKYAEFDLQWQFERTYYSYLYDSVEQCMEAEGLTEEQFRLEMAYQWMTDLERREKYWREVEEYIRENPEKYADFDPDAYYEWEYSWYDSQQEYMDAAGLRTREEFVEEMTASWVYDQQMLDLSRERWEAFAKENPEKAAAFDADAAFYNSYYIYYSETPEAYREEQGIDEETYELEMKQQYMSQIETEQWRAEYTRREVQALGGDPDHINVMRNGKMLSYDGVKPEISPENRTMVPFAQTMRQLQAQPQYDSANHAVTVTLQNLKLEHTIGTNVFTLTGPETELAARFENCTPVAGRAGIVSAQLTTDASSYIRDGQTMVPLSFFAGALGYQVTWDQDYRTVLLLDKKAMAQQIDTDFSLLNRVLKACAGLMPQQDGAVAGETALNLSLTLNQPGQTAQTFDFSANTSLLRSKKALNAQISAQMGDLIPLMDLMVGGSGMNAVERKMLEQMLGNVQMEYIVDLEGQVMYLKGELIDLLMQQLEEELGLQPGDYQWMGLYLSAIPAYMGGQMDVYYSEMSLGEYAAELAGAVDSVSFWSGYGQVMEILKPFVGDGAFTKTGNTYTLEYDLLDLLVLFSGRTESRQELEAEMESYMEEMPLVQLRLAVTPRDDSCQFQFTTDISYEDVAVDLDVEGSVRDMNLTLTVQMEDAVSLEMVLDGTIEHSDEVPVSAPPEGERVNYIQAGF